ncbi:MAG: protein kinase domain-containing protein [Planctomycetota bacterium]
MTQASSENKPSDAPSEASNVVERIIAEFLDSHEFPSSTEIEKLCERNQAFSTELRRRLATLQRLGLWGERPTEIDAMPERLGEFRLIRRLGGGGMGVVYEAEQTSLARIVALKLIRPEHLYFPGARERFRREVETVAKLQHSGIVPIYTVGEEKGIPYFAMERIVGCTLADVLEHLGNTTIHKSTGRDFASIVAKRSIQNEGDAATIPTAPLFEGSWANVCLRIFRDVALALEHAHARGVIHRDLKPSNIFVTPDGRVLLFDFGLAASTGANTLTRSGSQVGSVPYMSPEVISGDSKNVTASTDIYSLGVTFYELLTLHAPYLSETVDSTQRRILEGDPIPPRRLNIAISNDTATVCLKAMDRDPARRYASAAALARDLTNILEQRPIEAKPPTVFRKFQRWIERHPAQSVALILGFLLLVGGPSGFAILTQVHNVEITNSLDRETKEKTRAEKNFKLAVRSVDRMLSRVGALDLKNIPQVEPVRRKLLEDALQFSEQFLIDKSDDANVLRERARTLNRVGEIRYRLDSRKEAEEAFQEAIAILEKLRLRTTIPESSLDFDSDLASVYRMYGRFLLSLEKATAGAELMQKALELNRNLLARTELGADATEIQTNILEDMIHLGFTYRVTNKAAEARAILNEALQIANTIGANWNTHTEIYAFLAMVATDEKQYEESERLARSSIEILENELAKGASTENISLREALATTYTNLATTLGRTGRTADSIIYQKKTVELRESLCNDFPFTPVHRHLLGQAYNNLALNYFRQNQIDLSLEYYQKAATELQKLVDGAPHILEYLITLISSSTNRCGVLDSAGRDEEAIAILVDSVRRLTEIVQKHDDNAAVHKFLSHASNNLGSFYVKNHRPSEAAAQFRTALASARKLSALSPNSIELKNNMALFANNLGCLLRDGGDKKEAEELLLESVGLFEQFRGKITETAEFLLQLAQAHADVGLLYHDEKRLAESSKFALRALELQKEAIRNKKVTAQVAGLVAEHTLAMARLLALAEEFDAVVQFAAEMPSLISDPATAHQSAAEVLAYAGVYCNVEERVRELNQSSMKSLRTAIEAGFTDKQWIDSSQAFQKLKLQKEFVDLINSIPEKKE